MNELLWFGMLLVNFILILVVYRWLGKLGLYIWIPISVIIANIQVVKTVALFGVTATLGNIVYGACFLVTDILSEYYSKEEATKAVHIGFFSLISMTILMQLALIFKPGAEDFSQGSLVTIFSLMPRIALGSLVAYYISQRHDVWAYQFWKRRLPSRKHLWIRNNASTLVSQLIDTAIFTTISFLGEFSFRIFMEIALSTYLLKLIVALLDTPFLYIASLIFTKKDQTEDF